MPDGSGLGQSLREILTIGDEMLALLQPEMTEAETREIERLVDRRETVIQAVTGKSGGPDLPESVRTILRQVVEQQAQIENRMQSALISLRRRQGELLESQEQITGFRRMLQQGPRSRSLNERR